MSKVKFNGFENYLIEEALNSFSSKMESEVKESEESGRNLIYGPGFFKMTCDELIRKVNDMTLKKYRKV